MLVCALLALLGMLLCSASRAQSWPVRPIRLVVAYPPGGASDQVARGLAEGLAQSLGTPVLVENRAGASGSLALDFVAKAAPDGYTLAFSALSPLTILPHLGKLPFDPVRDIAAVAGVMSSPVLIVATSACGCPDLNSLLEKARAHAGAVRWATSGNASLGHLMLEQIQRTSKVQITHVPYKGGGQQITDALGGQFEVLSVNASAAVLQHVQAGRLRVLAVGGVSRLEALPEVPTLPEAGLALAVAASVFGIFAPPGLPAPVLGRLEAQVQRTMAEPVMQQRLLQAQSQPAALGSVALTRLVASESALSGQLVREASIRAD